MSTTATSTSVFSKDNLVAWCIVPFDASKRGPRERAEMLKRLGVRSLAYDWRDEHLDTFDEELRELRAQDIRMSAFYWMAGWPESEEQARANPRGRDSLDFFERNQLKIDVWVTCKEDGAEGITDEEEKLDAVANRVSVMAGMMKKLGCRLSLYNHGGWGGMPRNMAAIARRLESLDVGIAYNFHHGHDHMDDMPGAFEAMLPYLSSVNLNGVTVGGPKILPVGQGKEDLRILRMIRDSGYAGPIGVLDHRPEIDAEESLSQNIEGLHGALRELGDEAALSTY